MSVEDELRRARFHERENYARWREAEARVAAILLEVEGITHHYLHRYDDPKVQAGADVVCSRLDVLLEREGKRS